MGPLAAGIVRHPEVLFGDNRAGASKERIGRT